jgi:hypothetical protein
VIEILDALKVSSKLDFGRSVSAVYVAFDFRGWHCCTRLIRTVGRTTARPFTCHRTCSWSSGPCWLSSGSSYLPTAIGATAPRSHHICGFPSLLLSLPSHCTRGLQCIVWYTPCRSFTVLSCFPCNHICEESSIVASGCADTTSEAVCGFHWAVSHAHRSRVCYWCCCKVWRPARLV